MPPKPLKDIARLQFDVRRAQLVIIDMLVDVCGLSSKKELFNNSLALMKWAVQETQKGRRIASYDVDTDEIEMVALPALSFAAASAQHNQQEKEGMVVEKENVTRKRGAVQSPQLDLVKS